jgi:eukaryotic-like serine/threonine-protein kinase
MAEELTSSEKKKARADETVIMKAKGIADTVSVLLPFEQEAAHAKNAAAAGAGGAAGQAAPAMAEATEFEARFYRSTIKRHEGSRYRFEGGVIRGGMGAIHKVFDLDLLRLSAMKVMLPAYKSDERHLKAFITEAKITGLLEHPCIIPVHEMGLSRKTGIYFTMKFARGESLRNILNELEHNNPEYRQHYNIYRMMGIFRKVCDALSFAHSRDIIHQDLKPHNIMVGKYGEVLLMDWGIAKYIGKPEDEPDPVGREILREIAELTKGEAGQIKGTPSYMSPEQTMGDPNMLDKQSDIFLLGSTLYHMMTLQAPYSGEGVYDIIGQAMTGQFIPPQQLAPGWLIPEDICRIIERAMAFKKQDRYESVDAMIRDIDDFLEGCWTDHEKKIFAPGEMLMREGDAGEEAYMILRGRVQVFRETGGQRVVLGLLQEGDIVGEMALIVNDTRSASVEAIDQTEVSVLKKQIFTQNLKKLPRSIEKIVQSLAGRLIAANTKINPHMTEDASFFVLQQLRLIYRDRLQDGAGPASLAAGSIVEEIAENLGIAQQKVTEALKKASLMKLIVYDGDELSVPDMEELAQFIRFGRGFYKKSAVDPSGGQDDPREVPAAQ